MACVDIYQAASEERPCHAKRGHEEMMRIMRANAGAGKIDAGIVNDIDIALAPFDGGDLPAPAGPAP
ncbi:MAG: hypothetical protein FWE09_09510 [Treponema sp.]|nr:hypothetical protein [Treponema sp.]